jgi:23S rRNA pseudouridine2457 synthase
MQMSTVVLFNKPYGVLCQFSRQAGRQTLKDFIPHANVYPVGRLDADSEGLGTTDDDGALQHRIADPRYKRAKTYLVQVEGVPSENALAQLRKGVRLGDMTTQPAEARLATSLRGYGRALRRSGSAALFPRLGSSFRLHEGKNRQARHMTAAVGLPTLRLIRYAVGDWTIEGLAPGQWRDIEVETPASSVRRPHAVQHIADALEKAAGSATVAADLCQPAFSRAR